MYRVLITDSNYEAEVKKFSGKVIIFCERKWKDGNYIMTHMLDSTCIKYKNQIKFGIIDIEENELLRKVFLLDGHTTLFINRGELIDYRKHIFLTEVFDKHVQEFLKKVNG